MREVPGSILGGAVQFSSIYFCFVLLENKVWADLTILHSLRSSIECDITKVL